MAEDFYIQLTNRDEQYRQHRNEANTKNTELLHQMAQLDEDYKAAVRNGDAAATAEVRDRREKLKTDIEYHAMAMEALKDDLRDDPEAVRMAKGVHAECKQRMAEVRRRWNTEKATMAEAIVTILACAERLGELAARGDAVYGRVQHAVELTGLNLPYIQNPASVDVNEQRKVGVIYPDVKEIEVAFKRGRAKRS